MCDNYDQWPPIEDWISALFPNLPPDQYQEKSELTCAYNCIAFAAEDTENWWWPSEDAFWPVEIVDDSVASFEYAFKVSRNYEPCQDGQLEAGFQKVAVYAAGNRVKHMARQTDNGLWTSKLGFGWDISHHSTESLISSQYGDSISYLRRPMP
jgi:hypothetical protein